MPLFLVTLPPRALIALVRLYRFVLSPWLGSACRFEPTCSAYSLQALQRHGAAAGTYLTLHRLCRCHPGCAGGFEPVPEQRPRLFRFGAAPAASEPGRASSHSVDPTSS
jgi:putative membrane protein insertion efficiency factor